MFRRHIANRLNIGRYLGIDLYIHWKFWLLVIGVGGSGFWSAGWIALDETRVVWHWPSALWGGFGAVAQIAALFLCVTLHEYGHALMARRFDVKTVDITLLPIGGLARLERMPRKPWQELLVAVAGPAVNVVIAFFTAIALFIWARYVEVSTVDEMMRLISEHPLGWLLMINVALVVFNMVPAFPMDGGRVLRSFLAMMADYGTATYIASRIGFVVAAGMAVLGFMSGQFTVMLVAGFIGYAGWVESRQVAITEAMRGIRVEDLIERWGPPLGALDTLDVIADRFATASVNSLPVVGIEGFFLGMVDRAAVTDAAERDHWSACATDLMRDDEPTFRVPGSIGQQIAALAGVPADPIAVIDHAGRYVGVVRLDRVWQQMHAQRHRAVNHEEPITAVLVERSPLGQLPRSGEML